MKWFDLASLQTITRQIHFYEHEGWMGDYDPNEVGEYLQQFDRLSSGRVNWFETDMWYPSRGDFLCWRYRRTNKQ